MKPEHKKQPYKSYFAMNVRQEGGVAFEVSGQKETGSWYSLGVQSTVPFVEFIGEGVQKIISWNETIYIPPEMQCRVINRSFHNGDVQVQSGTDYGAIPARITVPAPLVFTSGEPGNYQPEFWVDTRRCRRAYLITRVFLAGSQVTAWVLGRQKIHSHRTGADVVIPNGYQNTVTLGAATEGWVIPLGFRAEDNATPMALLDQATVLIFDTNTPTVGPTAFFVLEY